MDAYDSAWGIEGVESTGHGISNGRGGELTEIYIPVRETNEVVAVSLNALPEDPTDVLEILQAEQAPLGLWLEFAKAYLRQGKEEEFKIVLEDGSSPEIEKYYADSKYERIRILVALAEYYMRMGRSMKDKRKKDEYFTRTAGYLNSATRIDQNEMLPILARGQLALTKGNLDEANKLFDQATDRRDNKAESIMPMLGKASVLFHKKLYPGALRLYEHCLRTHPTGPAAVRLGIAMCHLKMGKHLHKAKAAFRRVLQLDPRNVHAHVGLAITEMNSGTAHSEARRAGITEGLHLLGKAYAMDGRNANILNHLANHFLMLDDFDKVVHLGNTAFNHTDSATMKAESCYLLARAYHAQGQHEEARQYYSTAVSLVEEYAPAHHGLAQLELRQNRVKAALMHFEKVMAAFPGSLDVLKAVGSLHLAAGRKEKAMEALQNAAQRDPSDPETWIELGEVLEGTDPTEALKAYQASLRLMRRAEKGGGDAPPAALLNNAAVLEGAAGNGATALELMTEAVAAAGIDIEGEQLVIPGEEGAAIVFNLAVLREEMLQPDAAKGLFAKVLEAHPAFADCHLRAARAARARGDLTAAMEEAQAALAARPGDPDALALVGSLHMHAARWSEAQTAFRTLQGKGPGATAPAPEELRNDAYAMLSVANIIYYNALKDGAKVHSDEGVKRKLMERLTDAMTLYQKVLHLHSDNIYAANGIGVCLAEQGKIDQAKDVFTSVQEVAAGSTERCLPDVWVNLAHIYLALAQYNSAIKMYQGCLRKFYYNCDAQVMLYMARAYYDWDKLQDCKRTLLRALHLKPTDHRLRFNIALAMQEFAYRTLQRQASSATKRYSDVVTAVEELRLALKFFAALKDLPPPAEGAPPLIQPAKLQTHVRFCADTLSKAQNVLDAARREEEKAAARREEQRQRLRAETALKAAEEARKKEEEKRAFEEAQAQALANEERLKKLRAQWAVEVPTADAYDNNEPLDSELTRSPVKKKKLQSLPDGEDDSSEDDEYDPLRDKSSKAALAAAGLGSSSDEDEEKGSDDEEAEYRDSGLSSDEDGGMEIDEDEDEERASKKKAKASKKDKKDRKKKKKDKKRKKQR
eukprot:CAMPEP_0118921074 /NCGR_PEP_ID=MMETSP1169-20130426/461_1 /TAXON_ID=36882 /ORGANISM="Pyramimonas obovata, Strain CCMP722" /LENGTH=1092 /DNA_ID=CAMNT_0006861731 /DNA_START=195 /DNA_END=3470 /DNA_ORIENTATION=-